MPILSAAHWEHLRRIRLRLESWRQAGWAVGRQAGVIGVVSANHDEVDYLWVFLQISEIICGFFVRLVEGAHSLTKGGESALLTTCGQGVRRLASELLAMQAPLDTHCKNRYSSIRSRML